MSNKPNLADVVAQEMANIVESPQHKEVFENKRIEKSASNKEEEKPKQKKKLSNKEKLALALNGIAKISDMLDSMGLEKTAVHATKTMELLLVESDKNSKKSASEDKSEEDKEKKDDEEVKSDENDCGGPMYKADDHDYSYAEDKDVIDLLLHTPEEEDKKEDEEKEGNGEEEHPEYTAEKDEDVDEEEAEEGGGVLEVELEEEIDEEEAEGLRKIMDELGVDWEEKEPGSIFDEVEANDGKEASASNPKKKV